MSVESLTEKLVEKVQESKLKALILAQVESFDQCFRCGACSGICPVKKTTQVFDPRKIIHLLLLGFKEKVLNKVVWYCSQCESCVPVCPMDVKPKEVIAALRKFMLEEGLITLDDLFELGKFARVIRDKCIVCLTCVRLCPFSAPIINLEGYAEIQVDKCKACGICVQGCPARAIELRKNPEYMEVRY